MLEVNEGHAHEKDGAPIFQFHNRYVPVEMVLGAAIAEIFGAYPSPSAVTEPPCIRM